MTAILLVIRSIQVEPIGTLSVIGFHGAVGIISILSAIGHGISVTEEHDAELVKQFPAITSTWLVPASFDKTAELQACLVRHAHRADIGQRGDKRRHVTVGEHDRNLTLTITKWTPPADGAFTQTALKQRTAALQCEFTDGRLVNARLSTFTGDWQPV